MVENIEGSPGSTFSLFSLLMVLLSLWHIGPASVRSRICGLFHPAVCLYSYTRSRRHHPPSASFGLHLLSPLFRSSLHYSGSTETSFLSSIRPPYDHQVVDDPRSNVHFSFNTERLSNEIKIK